VFGSLRAGRNTIYKYRLYHMHISRRRIGDMTGKIVAMIIG
jgi:hypothetical protein